MNDGLAIIIPHLNYKGILEFLTDISQQEEISYHVIIINNGDVSLEQQFSTTSFVSSRFFLKNQGVARSWNIGLNWAIEKGFKNFLWLNDDVRLDDKKFLYNCLKIIKADDVVCNSEQIMGSGWFFGYNFDIVNEIGEFDEQFFPCFYEDNDIDTRLINAHMRFIPLDGIGHNRSSTIGKGNYEQVMQSMQELYEAKWRS